MRTDSDERRMSSREYTWFRISPSNNPGNFKQEMLNLVQHDVAPIIADMHFLPHPSTQNPPPSPTACRLIYSDSASLGVGGAPSTQYPT